MNKQKASRDTGNLAILEQLLDKTGPLAVAVSGGIDSMTLACAAHRVNREVTMYHALSPAVPDSATQRVQIYADMNGWHLELINAGEMDDVRYRSNPVNRCYYCKSNLYSAIRSNTDALIVSGTNTDDLEDFRPGLQAAAETGVHHPYVDAGIDKKAVRLIARQLGLQDLAELPASPCLSSRVSTGIPINAQLLPLIDITENRLRAMAGLNDSSHIRCRIRDKAIAVELDGELSQAQHRELHHAIRTQVASVFSGTAYSALSDTVQIETYRQGSAFIGIKGTGVKTIAVKAISENEP